MAEELITGKVARVLNSREVVINRGADDGVVKGTIFEVLDADGSDISDPDTGEVIGSVHRPKVRVRVTEVQPKLCLAGTFRVRRVNVGGVGSPFLGNLTSAMAPPKWVERVETFKSEDAAWEKISEAASYVKRGDPVRQVVEQPPELVEELEASEPEGEPTPSELEPAEEPAE